jgi:hypothetical protein
MAHVFSFVAALAVCLIATSSALGLDEIGEEFGNAPQAGLSPGQLAILNDPHRVYLYHVASDGYKSYVAGYFQGDTAAAQDALRKFAALDKGLDVVLLPGPREVTTIAKKKRVNADWELRIPERAGLRGHNPTLLVDARPTLYLYVRLAAGPANPATPEQVALWLKALDADNFKERDRASAELEKQGVNVLAALRTALQGQPSAEVRQRIGRLLGKLEGPGINVNVLVIPDGVRFLGPDQLLARYREDLKSDEVRTSNEVPELMSRFRHDPALLPILTQLLSDKDGYKRQHAAVGLGRMGKAATPALPALRAAFDDPQRSERAFQEAITSIEAAKDEPGAAERVAKVKAVREEIARFVKARTGKAEGPAQHVP